MLHSYHKLFRFGNKPQAAGCNLDEGGVGRLNLHKNSIEFLPRLRAALEIAKTYEGSIQENDIAWNIVKREAFYVVDALESASCVLENHLVTNHQKAV